MRHYLIRTLQASGTRILLKDKSATDGDGEFLSTPPPLSFSGSEEASAYAQQCPGAVTVHAFESDAHAYMALDPACVAFRTQHA